MLNPDHPDYSNTPASDRRPVFAYSPLDQQQAPVISIVTPFYNTGEIFHETACSIFRQSLQQWEWIIINDGSTDPVSLEILGQYRSMDPRIRVVDHEANRGLPAARNTGARNASTDFLLYIDSDDLLEPTAAEKWLWYLTSYSKYSFTGGYSTGFGAREYIWRSGFQDNEVNLKENRINHVVMIRKETWEKVGGYDESMLGGLEDWDFWVRAASCGYWGNSVPEFLHWYRTRPTHTDRWEGLNPTRLKQKRDEFYAKYPDLWKGGFPKPYSGNPQLDVVDFTEETPCENRLKKEKPRLLIIAPWLVTGGAEKFNLDVIRQLSQRGWEISIATTYPSKNPWQHEFENLTPDVFPMQNFLEWKDYPRFLSYLIKSRQFDAVLITASQEGYRLLPYLRLRFPDLPILDYVHFVTMDWLNGGFPRLSLMFHSSLDLSLVTSRQVKDWMVANGAEKDRVQVCTANIDVHEWRPEPTRRAATRAKLGIPDDTALILYVGRIERQKQPKVFARTIQLLATENLPFVSMVVGDGSLRDWLKEFVVNHQLENHVRFTGAVPLEEVQELMQAGDIVFLPSENEGISLTFFEGMATGLVPVGADVGGQSELVTPDCGLLFPRSTEEEEARGYSNALADLIRNPQKRVEMGIASRERVVEHFSLEKLGENLEKDFGLARRLRREAQRAPDREEMAGYLARQSAEFFRTNAEVHRLGESIDNYFLMPPAPATTYLYFAVRQAMLPILGRYRDENWLIRLKVKLKGLLIK